MPYLGWWFGGVFRGRQIQSHLWCLGSGLSLPAAVFGAWFEDPRLAMAVLMP